MTSGIPGSGGPGGPGGAGGPGAPDDVGDAEAAVESGAPLEVHAARTAAGGAASGTHATGAGAPGGTSPTSGIDRIAADLDAGRISGREALDRLIDEAVPDEAELGPEERAELRDAMRELIANDPHLQALAARIGAGSGDD